MMKQDLQKAASVSWTIVTKMLKSEIVSTEVLMKIYKVFRCNIRDIIDFVETSEERESK